MICQFGRIVLFLFLIPNCFVWPCLAIAWQNLNTVFVVLLFPCACITKRRVSEIYFGRETASISPLLYLFPKCLRFRSTLGRCPPSLPSLPLSHPKRLCYQKDSAATQMILRKAICFPTRRESCLVWPERAGTGKTSARSARAGRNLSKPVWESLYCLCAINSPVWLFWPCKL